MDKKLQDLVWSILPKWFKEEVKKVARIYSSRTSALFGAERHLANKFLDEFIGLFGRHNLTSDAEGEEMLTVSRKRVQEVYAKNIAASNSDGHNSYDYGYYDGVINILSTLFGSKCLPDNVDSLDSNVDSLEPKPAEPKLRRGSFAYHDNVKVRITKIKANGDVIAYTKDGYRLIGRECDFEPYTEPAEEASPNVNSSDIDIDELVAKGCVPDPAKQFDNILKDSLSKERRLTIAAQMMQGLICAPFVPGIDPNPPAEHLAQAAFRLADALMAEAEKGGDK